jgi:NAD(P)-dependent dehydrogenase (short-subunit alcohol dehydrogenase family)
VLHAVGAAADAHAADLADPAARASLVARLNAAYPRIDALVNNAYAGPVGTWAGASSADGHAYEIAAFAAAFDLIRGLEPGLTPAHAPA